jgi:hypothetical protein
VGMVEDGLKYTLTDAVTRGIAMRLGRL